jgi:hypothetical protein
LKNPTQKEAEEGVTESLVFGPEAVVAADSQAAAIKAVMDSGQKLEMARCTVIVRPFA